MKRLLSLALAAALLAALTLPASAEEETADARLSRVTRLVKDTLGLDTGAYENFRGGCSEELAPVWTLEWERDGDSVTVEALEDGTVVRFYRWQTSVRPAGASFPAFPGEDGGARAAAEGFLSRVLREGETAQLEDSGGGLGDSGQSWSGWLRLNGLPSPLRFFITVEDGQVRQFSRDVPETSAVGGVPSPGAAVERDRAEEALHETLGLRLEYVLENPGGGRAVLRYVPEKTHEFCVDAGSGALLDLTELAEKLARGYNSAAGGAAPSAAPTAAEEEAAMDEGGLTEAEQKGVQEMEGILTREELDRALRGESAYGLRGYALVSASYETNSGGEGGVRCSLRYARTDGGERLTRNITVDARTGAVESVWSSAPYGREKKVTEEAALEKAGAFLRSYCPERELALYETGGEAALWRTEDSRPDWSFTFVREVNGLPFRSSVVSVSIDGADGSIYALSSSWDEDVSFDSPEGVVTPETALSAWAGTYETVLAYRNVPRKLSGADPAQARLMEQGMEYYYGLCLTYALEQEAGYEGIDARTGRPVREAGGNARGTLAYDDLAGSFARGDIEKLAGYGVGYASGSFRPGRSVTQWDLAALVYSLQGAAVDPESAGQDERDDAYYYAYRMGLLKPGDRDEGAVLTRGALVKLLLNAAGYGPAARLGGIYACGYADRDAIPAGDLGYAAIAEALGMASGSYAASRPATRGEAASMLCRLLERAA